MTVVSLPEQVHTQVKAQSSTSRRSACARNVLPFARTVADHNTGVMASGPNRVLAAVVGVVVLLAAIAGVVAANRTAPSLDPSTPEGVVQEYLKAVLDGDYPAAAKLLSSSSGCDLADVSSVSVSRSARIVLEDTVVDGDTAVVTVDVTEGADSGPFGDSGYSHTERITVERDGGAWKISGSPWLLYPCGSTKG